MILKVSNPRGGRAAKKKKRAGAQKGTTTMAKKKRRTAARKRTTAPKPRKRKRARARSKGPCAHMHALQVHTPKKYRKRVAKVSNPSRRRKGRRVIRRRRNPSSGKGTAIDGMTIAKAIGAGLAGGAAVTLANFAFNKSSGGAGKAMTLGIAAVGVIGGAVLAKKDLVSGLSLAVGSAGAAGVPMMAQKIFELTQPKMAAIVDMRAIETRPDMGALVDGPTKGLPGNIWPRDLPGANLGSVDSFTDRYAQGVQQMAAIGADPYAEHDPI